MFFNTNQGDNSSSTISSQNKDAADKIPSLFLKEKL